MWTCPSLYSGVSLVARRLHFAFLAAPGDSVMSTTTQEGPALRPPQHQNRMPGLESEMNPPPRSKLESYRASGKLENKVALISGGDSGIGRAVAVAFAKEGADVAIAYLDEHDD